MMKLTSVDWKQKPNPRERIIFFSTLVVMLLGFVKSCWMPSREALTQLHEELGKAEQEVKVAQEMKVHPATPTPSKPVLSGEETIKSLIGRVQDVAGIVQQISQPLLLKGVQVKGVKVADLEREGSMVRRKLELTVIGNFYAVGQYMETLEGFETPFVIEDFSMQRSSDKSTQVEVTLKGLVYGADR